MNKPLQIKLENLFKWTGELEITDEDGNVIETLYQRVIGDADVQKARLAALKESRQLRRRLQDPDSDEALANIPLKGELSQEEMVDVIIFSRYNKYRAQAELRISEKKIKEPPSDADLEDQEQYIEDVEQAQREYEEKLTDAIHNLAVKDREKLLALPYDKVMELHTDELIDYLCAIRMMTVYDQMSAFLGTYSDPEFTTRRFARYEDFDNLATLLKERIVSNYKRLPLETEDLKK